MAKSKSDILIHNPKWFRNEPRELYCPLPEQRMLYAIHLAKQNVLEKTGGPFGAAVFTLDGHLVAAGVNLVISAGFSLVHAEIMATMNAQHLLETHDLKLSELGPLELVSSAQPCIQCYGSLFLSGFSSLVTGATGEDVEKIGFREGPIPKNWVEELEAEGMQVTTEMLRKDAQEPLQLYKNFGMPIYNSGV